MPPVSVSLTPRRGRIYQRKKPVWPTLSVSHAALVMPSFTYVCTVINVWRPKMNKWVMYMPPDGVCDILLYDSLYKNNKKTIFHDYGNGDCDLERFLHRMNDYSRTEFGLPIRPE
ncbi:hypothetical protein MRX96_007702 [Rhipicephalus microplus]